MSYSLIMWQVWGAKLIFSLFVAARYWDFVKFGLFGHVSVHILAVALGVGYFDPVAQLLWVLIIRVLAYIPLSIKSNRLTKNIWPGPLYQ